MRREIPPKAFSNRHGSHAGSVDYVRSRPAVAIPAALRPHRGLECLIGGRGRARGWQGLQGIGALYAEQAVVAARSAQLRVAIARSAVEIDAAHDLVRRRYAWRGYEVEAIAGDCAALARRRLEQEITIVAATREATIGTVTLRVDGPCGLVAEETHGAVIQTARASGRRVCELTRLAVAECVDSKSVLASLFGLAYASGRAVHDVTDVFIEVNPRHVAYYSRILGFVVAAGEKLCERVRAPSVLLHAEVEALAARLRAFAETAMPQTLLVEAA